MEEKKNEVVQKAVKIDDVWDDGTEFIDRSLKYNEETGDYYHHRETIKKEEEKVAPKPAFKYTPKEANSKKNKYKPNPSVKLNDADEEDYDYDNDYDDNNEQYYKKK